MHQRNYKDECHLYDNLSRRIYKISHIEPFDISLKFPLRSRVTPRASMRQIE